MDIQKEIQEIRSGCFRKRKLEKIGSVGGGWVGAEGRGQGVESVQEEAAGRGLN